jgi:fructokinase
MLVVPWSQVIATRSQRGPPVAATRVFDVRSDGPMLSVLGELVVDLLPSPDPDAGPQGTAPSYVARPGGNALNVAVAAGRLGTPVRLMARLGTGPLAANLRRHAELAGIDLGGFVEADEPVSLAVVGLTPDGSPDYGFHVLGAADWQWTDDELARVLPSRTAILHVGSISSWTAPGSEAIARLVERISAEGSALISVDPNVRPMLAEGPVGTALGNTAEIVRGRLDRLISRADVVKVSAEDLAWLAPGATTAAALDATARQWAERGPALVLVTDGSSPLRIARPGHAVLHWRIPRVSVVDTVGAGDSLAAGLLTGLLESGVTGRAALEALPDEDLLRLVDDAALIAALNCTRVGADPPTRAEFAAARTLR